MRELLRKICIYLHLTTLMVDVYESLEREQFTMMKICSYFLLFYGTW